MAKPTQQYLDEDEMVRINFLVSARERNQFLAACKGKDRTMSLMLRDMVRAVIAQHGKDEEAA